jgi:ligand-binding SRPBCC domain-containing protein
MKVYLLTREIYIRKPLSEVFSFFDRPENLTIITPKTLAFKIFTPAPIKMGKGALIDYSIKIFRIPFHWRTLITTYEPPNCFIDEQLKGPYAFWHHKHTFFECNEGTLMKDLVHYALPFGPIGILTHALFVKKQINYIFDYRTKIINDLFSK